MRKFTTIAALILSAGLGACATPTAKPIPQAQQSGAVTQKDEPAAEAPSSCDVVREALLTGAQAEIDAAMAALQADREADATAREYADYYLHRDAGDAQLREMDVSLIRMSCG